MLAARVDRAVIETVARDLQSPQFVTAAVKSLRVKFAVTHAEEIAAARAEIAKLDERSGRLLEMASERKSRAAVLRKVDDLEDRRAEIERRILAWEKEDESGRTPWRTSRMPRSKRCWAAWPKKCSSISAMI
jgi:uncharacterized protein YhaN